MLLPQAFLALLDHKNLHESIKHQLQMELELFKTFYELNDLLLGHSQ
jgi:hypothetical protein